MSLLTLKARTLLALGIGNVARIATYRLGVKLGINPAQRHCKLICTAPFFTAPIDPAPTGAYAPSVWTNEVRLFGRWPIEISDHPPDWLANPLTGQRVPSPERGWWEIPDFDPAVGDIKPIWELSRMDWVLAFAQQARCSNPAALERANAWLADWCAVNPPYKGPNWKCGQEASIRLMHLAMTALILGQVRNATPSLSNLVRVHLQRISPTLQYAMAQDNNHGTSEAAALFIGGSWLAALGDARGEAFAHTGRHLLENRVARLIGLQGSFSQYSLNYHRVLLDTLCMAEVWRATLGLRDFSPHWRTRTLAATQWLRHMVDPAFGDGPNIGANDGARLLPLSDAPFRDYRPSVQLASVLFAGESAYVEGAWNQPLLWLGLRRPQRRASPPTSCVADDGGFAVLRRGRAVAILRYPRFRFRPSQADALHLDLTLNGTSLLRDAGSYSYNTEPRWLSYFGGTASHNTIQFDDRDQMPRLGRFLFGAWLDTRWLEPIGEDGEHIRFGAGYCDHAGASHRRRLTLSDRRLLVEDEVAGFALSAVLRWRLPPGDWRVRFDADAAVIADDAETKMLVIRSSMPALRCEIVQGWESRHYLEMTPVSVVEFAVSQSGMLTTEISWAQ